MALETRRGSTFLQAFAQNSLATVVNGFAVYAISAATAVFTARALAPHGRGQYALAVLIPLLAVAFGRLGLGHAANFFAPRTSRGKLVSNILILSIGLSLLTTAVALSSALLLEDLFFKDMGRGLIVLSSFAIPFNMLFSHATGLLQSLYPIERRNRIVLMQAMCNLGLLVFLVIAMGMGVSGAVVAMMVSLALGIALSWKCLCREIAPGEAHPDFQLMRSLLHFGAKSHVGNILKDLSYRGDILILSCYVSASSVGLYVTAVNIAEVLWKVPDAIGMVLLPRVAKMEASAAREFIPVVSRMVLVIVSLLCAGILAVNEKIIELLFGAEFLPSAAVLNILLPGILSLSVWKILANALVGMGHPTEYSLTTGTALLVMVILDLVCIPIFGIEGAAAASSAAYLSASALIIFLFVRLTNISVGALVIPSRSDLSIYRLFLRPLGKLAGCPKGNHGERNSPT